MSPEERADLEARADRCMRRGEVAEAVALLRQLHAAFPDDEALGHKLDGLMEALQPMELFNPKSALRSEAPVQLSPEQEGEQRLAAGDYAGAMAAYRQALMQKPDSALIRERLEEIFRMAKTLSGAPSPVPAEAPLPADPAALMEALLQRISARRRT